MRRFFRTRGAVTLELYAAILGEQLNGETSAALGYVLELCDLLAHFDHHSQSGVVYFGHDDLQQHQLSAEQLILRETMGSPAWLIFFNAEFDRAEKWFNSYIGDLPRTILVLKRYLHLRWQWLIATRRHGFPLYRYQLQLGLLHKHFICFKTNWL
jgi:phytoene/squalene synthetase